MISALCDMLHTEPGVQGATRDGHIEGDIIHFQAIVKQLGKHDARIQFIGITVVMGCQFL